MSRTWVQLTTGDFREVFDASGSPYDSERLRLDLEAGPDYGGAIWVETHLGKIRADHIIEVFVVDDEDVYFAPDCLPFLARLSKVTADAIRAEQEER